MSAPKPGDMVVVIADPMQACDGKSNLGKRMLVLRFMKPQCLEDRLGEACFGRLCEAQALEPVWVMAGQLSVTRELVMTSAPVIVPYKFLEKLDPLQDGFDLYSEKPLAVDQQQWQTPSTTHKEPSNATS